jgi:UDP-N-acetylglucosamine--N-acetylmuramyl-(pentapeptide) pyrophosphoryl-undecaprenol N-acetylglucosamine transferase
VSKRVVLLAGGGSGGHISPGIAIAEAIRRADPEVACVFACSDRAIDADMLTHASETFRPLPARPPTLRPAALLSFLRGFRASERQVSALLERHTIDAVVLLGGFVAATAARPARRAHVPTLLVNLDRVPGRANRWMRPRTTHAVSAVSTVRPFVETVTGMPIRNQAMPPGDRATCCELLGLDPAAPVLVITGASQGASTINKALPQLFREHPRLRGNWQIVHLTGPGHAAAAAHTWGELAGNITLCEFRHDMGPVWGAADLVISRAGACSVAEIEYAGIPAIYLPYPHHRDQHQRRNAELAVAAGAACIVEDTPDPAETVLALRSTLAPLMGDETARHRLKAAASARAGINAADTLAALTSTIIRTA